jgi:hypothetical protein
MRVPTGSEFVVACLGSVAQTVTSRSRMRDFLRVVRSEIMSLDI